MADPHGGARPSRFDTPAAKLDLGAVGARQARRARVISLAVAIVLHVSLAAWKVTTERKAIKPLTTRFIKREPRLVKPLELRKMPKPKRREMRRRMKQVRAKVDTRGISRAPKLSRVLEGMVRPVATVSQAASFERPALEPTIASETVVTAKAGGKRLDLALEMVDVGAFDFGQHKAMVIQDPTDKRRVKGFFKLASIYLASNEFIAETAVNQGAGGSAGGGFPLEGFTRQRGTKSLAWLAHAMNEYTDIQVDVLEGIAASDEQLLRIPWALLLPSNWADVTGAEARNLGKYLTRGGFLMVEGTWATEPRCRELFEQSLETQGLSRGQHWEFEQLPNDHPMYHSFFDFDGPPWGGDPFGRTGYGNVDWRARQPINRRDYIEGITLDRRLVAIYETKDYVRRWTVIQDVGWSGKPHDEYKDSQQLGINILVFALTQEGSLARQAVASGY